MTIVLFTLIGSIILRASVALCAKIYGSYAKGTNTLQSSSTPKSTQMPYSADPSSNFQSNSPYATPMATSAPYSDQAKQHAVPSEVTYGRAFAIILVIYIACTVVDLGVAFAAGAIFQPQSTAELESLILTIRTINTIISFFTISGIFMLMLSIPKFTTAMVLTLLFYLITIAVIIAIFLVVMFIVSGF